MPSRCAAVDDLQRYLEQQAALGTRRVLLSGPASGIVGSQAPSRPDGLPGDVVAASPEREAPRPPPSPPRATALPPSPVAPELDAAQPKWKKDAPAVYPAGLAVRSPSPGLLDGELDALPSLESLAGHIAACRRCALCEGRTNTVPGEGNPRARLLLIGEGPGENEDRQGRPFIGKAGELLTDILKAIDLPRETIFIANVVKCRPPQNRKPLPIEAASCLPYLRRQIALLAPDVLLALGSTAAEALLGLKSPLGELRGKVHTLDGRPLVVTYHPAALLRNPNWKKPTWDDVRVVRQLLDG